MVRDAQVGKRDECGRAEPAAQRPQQLSPIARYSHDNSAHLTTEFIQSSSVLSSSIRCIWCRSSLTRDGSRFAGAAPRPPSAAVRRLHRSTEFKNKGPFAPFTAIHSRSSRSLVAFTALPAARSDGDAPQPPAADSTHSAPRSSPSLTTLSALRSSCVVSAVR